MLTCAQVWALTHCLSRSPQASVPHQHTYTVESEIFIRRKICQFHHPCKNLYPQILTDHIDAGTLKLIDDMVTYTKNKFHEMFLQYIGSWAWQNFSAIQYNNIKKKTRTGTQMNVYSLCLELHNQTSELEKPLTYIMFVYSHSEQCQSCSCFNTHNWYHHIKERYKWATV